MDATSDLSFDNSQIKNLSYVPKTRDSLHDTIDKVAEKAKPAIDRLAQRAHRNVERLSYRGAQVGDTSKRYIQSHPLMSVGTVFFLSLALSKLICTRHK